MSYSNRLAVCESFEITEKAGVAVLTIHAGGPGATRDREFRLAPAGSMGYAFAMALEADRKAALESDDGL